MDGGNFFNENNININAYKNLEKRDKQAGDHLKAVNEVFTTKGKHKGIKIPALEYKPNLPNKPQSAHKDKKIVVWIDTDIYNKIYKDLIETNKSELAGCTIKIAHTIDDAFKIFKKYEFSLIYVIVSGDLSHEFIERYKENFKKLKYFLAIILYNYDKNKEFNTSYLNDETFNPGGATNDFGKVISYIQKDECGWNIVMNFPINQKTIEDEVVIKGTASYGFAPNLEDTLIPTILGKLIANKEVNNSDLINFMQMAFEYGNKELSKLARPTREKNIKIEPFHYSKFYIEMFELETLFKEEMQKNLAQNQINRYKPYIYILYSGLNQGVLNAYTEGKLFRLCIIPIDEFNKIKELYDKKKESNSNFSIAYYQANNFLKFTKNETTCNLKYTTLKKKVNPDENLMVKFVIDKYENQSKNYLPPNIDMMEYEAYLQSEKNSALVLPMASFEIISVDESNSDYKVVHLGYLDKFQNILDDLEKKKTSLKIKDVHEFYKLIINSGTAKDFKERINDNFEEDEIKYIIMDPKKREAFKKMNKNKSKIQQSVIDKDRTEVENEKTCLRGETSYIYAKYEVKAEDAYPTQAEKDGRLNIISEKCKELNKNNCNIYIDKKFSKFTTKLYSEGEFHVFIAIKNEEKIKSLKFLFDKCSSLIHADLFDFDSSEVTDTSRMFFKCSNLQSLEISNMQTSKVQCMNQMFSGCHSLKSISPTSFDTSNVTEMKAMFAECHSLENVELDCFDTSKVVNMDSMFLNCKSLQKINLETFVTSNVTNMMCFFAGCTSLNYANLSSFDTSNVDNFYGMFFECKSMNNLNLDNFDTFNGKNMEYMFFKCSKLATLNMKNWSTNNICCLQGMLEGCYSLANIILPKDISRVMAMEEEIRSCPKISNSIKHKFS